MTRVLHVLWSADLGGISRVVLDLATSQQRGDRVQPAFYVAKSGGELMRELESSAIPYICGSVRNGYDFSLSKLVKAVQVFRDNDIIHIHSFSPFVALAALISGRKIVYTIHGTFGFCRKRRRAEMVTEYMKRFFLNQTPDFVTFVSEFTAATAKSMYGLRRTTGRVVPNGISFGLGGVETDPVDADTARRLTGRFVVGITARLVAVKRIERLVTAFAEFSRDKDAVLLLVGDGPERGRLERLARRLEVREMTVFAGYRRNARAYQRAMDVCVMPSYGEAFGLVSIELFSLGKPVIVFEDGGGLVDIVSTVDMDDVVQDESALTRRLDYYYERRGCVDATFVRRRIRVAGLFHITRTVRQFETIYDRVMSGESDTDLVSAGAGATLSF